MMYGGMPSIWMVERRASRVVPAMGVTMARSPARRLSRMDLPTLGWPAGHVQTALQQFPWPARSKPASLACSRVRTTKASAAFEIDFLLRKIERASTSMRRFSKFLRFSSYRPRKLTLANATAERASTGSGGVDQVDNRFGLRQIHLAVEEGAAAELAGFGKARAEIQAAA